MRISPKMTTNASQKAVQTKDQYSLAKILGLWAAATLPMAVLSWVVFPLVAPDFESDSLGSGVTRVVLLTLGLVWQFVLSMMIKPLPFVLVPTLASIIVMVAVKKAIQFISMANFIA